MTKVIEEIDAGHPLIALLNTGAWIFSKGHFVVITGYDSRRGGIFVHSGASADQFISYDEFIEAGRARAIGLCALFRMLLK